MATKEMKHYSVWYSETDVYKAYFQAENLEEAKKIIESVRNGETNFSELLGAETVSKEYEIEIDLDTLDEW
jgi:hypothetical protein